MQENLSKKGSNPDLESSSDEFLIRRFNETGDNKAFEMLVGRNQKVARNILFSVLNGNVEDIKDAEQEILMALMDGLKNFRFSSSFKTFYYRFCRNKAIDFIKKKKRERKVFSMSNIEDMGSTATPEDGYIEDEKIENFYEILNSLNELDRSLILLKDIENLSLEEISKTCSIPVGTVKSKLHRARIKVKEKLKEVYL